MSSLKNNKTIKYALRNLSCFGSVAVAAVIAAAGVPLYPADELHQQHPVASTTTVAGEETKEVAVPEKLEEKLKLLQQMKVLRG